MFPFISNPGFPSFLLTLLFMCKSEFKHYFMYCIVRYSYFASSKYCFLLIHCILPELFIFLLYEFLPFRRNILLRSSQVDANRWYRTCRSVHPMDLPEPSRCNTEMLCRQFLSNDP